MGMTLLQGSFRIIKSAPDGDSIRFYAKNTNIWKKLPTPVRPNATGGVQLRLDSIDALETHFQARVGSLGTQHQPLKFAHAAGDELLKYLGFKNFTRNKNEVITKAEPEEVPGFILTRFADQYGRGVAFVFKGKSEKEDGSDVYLDEALLKKSANYHLLETGLVYPTFYSKLFPDLRKVLTAASQKARKDKKGLWELDKTNEGFNLENVETITDDVVILPKLFRRLISYLAINDGSASLKGFPAYLESNNDKVIILPDGHVTGFDYVVEVNEQNIKLKELPENLVFIEK
ncbi:MAG: thermonuclease family protein [Scytonematopsis contorta HA4267-MV1]|jgi:endonuclease YncB( thermonuclease family)|nr:thermonuclease family protein [Scytonematopsis contorta HA4267-MV1]